VATFGGRWTREKLEILERYLKAYARVMKNQPFHTIYIDAFAGTGTWQPNSGYLPEDYQDYKELLKGSAALALDIRDRAFDRLVFVEQDKDRSAELRALAAEHPKRHVDVIAEDANQVLPRLCQRMTPLDRAVVFLDPYATQVAWATVEAIAKTQKIDCWILFPLMAITRMMPRASAPDPSLEPRLNRVFGGSEHWKEIYHEKRQLSYFDKGPEFERDPGSKLIAASYRLRLESVFLRVAPTRRTFENSMNSSIFELFFAASNPVGSDTAIEIADHILRNW